MTRPELQGVLAYLAAAFPSQALNDATVEVYAESLATLEVTHARDAARRLVKSEVKFPTVARILEEVRAVKSAHEPEVKALAHPGMPGGEHLTEARKLLKAWKGNLDKHDHRGPHPCPICGATRKEPA